MGWRVSQLLAESIGSVRRLVAGLDVDALDGDGAAQLVTQFSELERLASAGRTLAAGRVARSNAWVESGHRDAGAWLASVAGTTVGKARATLETAERLGDLPATEAALRAGGLSEVQVDAVASAASADPSAERGLLARARTDGVKRLKTACAQVEAAASTDQDRRYEQARARRFLRHRALSDVESLIEMRGPIDQTARVMAALQPWEKEQFEQARRAERREFAEAMAFDAMVTLADDAAAGRFREAPSRPPATVVVRVDKSAFDRGETQPGELCEIAGVGPIPVSVAQELSADALLRSLITDGTAVLAVSNPGRTVPARLRVALEELQPECVIAGCHVDRHLEIDHNVPVTQGGRTELANLNRLCHHHHDLKTRKSLRLVGEGLQKRLVPAGRAPPDETAAA